MIKKKTKKILFIIVILFANISLLFSFQPQTKSDLQTAVDLWISNNSTALSTYGVISAWDVSLITDMSELFKNKTTFNDDISSWNVSNVITMNAMFSSANSFNGDLSSWDVSSVTDMNLMFFSANSFNGLMYA